MTKSTKYRQDGKGHVFNTLRREIQAARLKVILDEELGRPTSVKVRRLAAMDLPPTVRSYQRVGGVSERTTYDPTNKDQVFATLRREILAARLKVTLDEQLNRETSPTVKALAGMKLPPIVRPSYHSGDPKAEASRPATSRE
ncbi:hypothetical protein [Arthrobacter sp. U41]|uniref:hypothetical protein n=1 Tax=Arthrobacter sp. U41 TaxID=1849032 RepID=UPI0008592574|nr:hypothetical protein [Arthrobacter sp. U41]AOT04706.1 hypothetical protein ASPU41_16665 [Arthrobacter sp. U41]